MRIGHPLISHFVHGSMQGSERFKITEKRPFVAPDNGITNLISNDHHIAINCARLKEFLLELFIWGFTSLSTLYRSYHDG